MSDRRIPLTLGAIALAAFSLAGNVANAQMLSCDASPFGSAIVLNADREGFLGLVGLNGNGLGNQSPAPRIRGSQASRSGNRSSSTSTATAGRRPRMRVSTVPGIR